MSVKIRLKRMGKRNTPFYRLVVVDSRWKRDGKSIQDVGWYDPVKKPAQMSFKELDIYRWLEKGVQLSDTARNLLKAHGIIQKFKSGEYKEILESGQSSLSQETLTIGKIPEEKGMTPAEDKPKEQVAEATPVEEASETPASETEHAPAEEKADEQAEA